MYLANRQPLNYPLISHGTVSHYEYRVMAYGLSISPSVFQTFMNEVFREFLHRFVVVYIDDILIYSRNLADHRQHVLQKLCEHRLYLKLEKCEFHQSSVQFLGYVICAEGIQMYQGKIQAIQEWPTPNTVKKLQRFLGFSNFYHCFIQNYSIITAPLTSLLRAEPETILPPDMIVSPILWDLDQNIRNATLQEPAPPVCPEGKIYVPRFQRLNLLGTTHEFPGSGHPGSRRTLSLLQARYWCPRKLVPLPIPQRPWSHIGVDFITDLLNSEAMETAEHLFQHLFRNFGLPEKIVSDRSPQLISHIWKAFFKLLVISVNLSSGYHPQTNGQTERKIQQLRRYLWSYCQEDQHSWSRFLLWAEYAQNSLRQDTTGLTPFQCNSVFSLRCSPGWMNPPMFQL
ncbi:hypothetical protein M9458_029882, partial [Cirrhinus mrigala]